MYRFRTSIDYKQNIYKGYGVIRLVLYTINKKRCEQEAVKKDVRQYEEQQTAAAHI